MTQKNNFLYVINFKTYPGSWGNCGRKLARALSDAAESKGVSLVICISALSIHDYNDNLAASIFAQHVDGEEEGKHTGAILPEALKESGASGTLVNHSERPLSPDNRSKIVDRCRKLGITTIVCAQSKDDAILIAKLKPDFIAYEPPELIGSKDISVSQAKPDEIKCIIDSIDCPVLVGAGIHSKEDVQKAYELGARGVLVSSHVVVAKDAAKAFLKLII